MGQFHHTELRSLRQRLGWSQAEMSRRLGCSPETLISWENGSATPDIEAIYHMTHLWNHVEANAEKIVHIPIAETLMKDMGVDQIEHAKVLHNDREKN